MGGRDPTESFSGEFDDEFPVGPEEGNRAFFGRAVLRGLVDGIDDFIQSRQPRWESSYRTIGPALLGSAMWINDEELIDQLARLSAACIVVTKQRRTERDLHKLERLKDVNDRTPGMPVRALAGLGGIAPKVDGKSMVVGPHDRMHAGVIPTVRTLGYRTKGQELVPILHAKLALLGNLWWHDEDDFGPADVIGFKASRLWVSSANFTSASRRSLEFGYWTEHPALLSGAERFLVKVLGASEDLDPDADSFDPDLVPVEFDDVAMADAMRDGLWDSEHERFFSGFDEDEDDA